VDFFAGGVHVFRSAPPDPASVAEAGLYEALVRVPANLLAETVYSVDAIVRVLSGDQTYPLQRRGALSFRPYCDDGWRAKRVGVLRPLLDWRIEKRSDGGQI